MSLGSLSSNAVLTLSAVESIAGMMKSAGNDTAIGIGVLVLLSLTESIAGLLIAIAILVNIRNLVFNISKAIYVLAVIIDGVFLIFDISFSCVAMHKSNEANINRREKLKATLKALLFTLLSAIPIIVIIIAYFRRLKWCMECRGVTELVSSKNKIPPSLWMCIIGFVILIVSAIFIIRAVFVSREKHRTLYLVVSWISCVLGASFISAAGLVAEKKIAPGYMFVTIAVVPPLGSAISTGFRAYFLYNLRSDVLNTVYDHDPKTGFRETAGTNSQVVQQQTP